MGFLSSLALPLADSGHPWANMQNPAAEPLGQYSWFSLCMGLLTNRRPCQHIRLRAQLLKKRWGNTCGWFFSRLSALLYTQWRVVSYSLPLCQDPAFVGRRLESGNKYELAS